MASNRIRRAIGVVLLVASVVTACDDLPAPPPGTAASRPSAAPATQAQPPDAPAGSGPRYVAMGDSAAAAPLVPDQAQPLGCFKSTNDYPSVLARRIGAASFDDVTCSGARTEDLVSRSQTIRNGTVAPQVDAVAADTQLVTVTIGGNDVDLPKIASTCRRTSLDVAPCAPGLVADGSDGGDGISQAIDAHAASWSALIDAIRDKAPTARVIVVGYGTYVRPQGCFPAEPINPVDAAYFQSKVDELDARLQQVAQQRGVDFFDSRPLTVGHDICAAPEDRYVEGFAPIHPAAPLHPNGAGAAALGSALAAYLG
ncbi:SGNH/GDSL hydrolase family protein [Mycolicibacterium madagascariense]|nr:SGNH/GDSL hydrolase family protein [Mycolicibacterium madagascariense]